MAYQRLQCAEIAVDALELADARTLGSAGKRIVAAGCRDAPPDAPGTLPECSPSLGQQALERAGIVDGVAGIGHAVRSSRMIGGCVATAAADSRVNP